MKTFLIILSFHVIILKTETPSVKVSFISPYKAPLKFKEKITLTCKIFNKSKNSSYPVLILNNGNMVSENCFAFNTERYNIHCTDTDYIFTINELLWADKGKWDCVYNTVTESIILDIYVSNNVSISIIPKPFFVKSKNLGPESFPLQHESYYILNGRGTRYNPYDLRSDVSVNLNCKSECGYPAVDHILSFKNASNFSVEINKTSFKFKSALCETDKNTFSSDSSLEFNCLKYRLHGLINLTCSTFHSNVSQLKISEQNIFILCPTDPIQWWKMTYGELINTVIGCLVAFLLLMSFCLMMCRLKSYKHKNNYDTCQEDSGDTKLGRGYRV